MTKPARPVRVQRRVEELDPEVVARCRCAAGRTGSGGPGRPSSLSRSLSTRVDVERRIGQDEVEAADRVVRVVVVAVDVAAVADVALEAVHREVHAAEAAGLVGLLDAVDRRARAAGFFWCSATNRARLHEHAARAAGGVEDAAVERLDHLDDQPDDAARRVELAAPLALGRGELAEEVLVDAPEGVALDAGRDLGDLLEQLLEQRAGEEVVGLGQHAGELRVVLLDVAHRLVDLAPTSAPSGRLSR